MTETRETLEVERWEPAKSYGFLKAPAWSSARGVFCHESDCPRRLRPGERVTAALESTPRGLKARAVKLEAGS